MQRLTGVVQHYHWGSTSRIPRILGVEPDGRPWAEYWLGSHALGTATITPEYNLQQLIDADPSVLGSAAQARFGNQLPFLLKILAASTPLSLQAHPSREQAEAGFQQEEAAEIELTDPERIYKDPWPKPEILVALTKFQALAGFRNPKRTAELFAQLEVPSSINSIIAPLTERSESAGLAEVFLDLLSLDEGRRHIVEEVTAAAVSKMSDEGELGLFAQTAVELDEHFPGDPSILAALLMNRVTLNPGEALYMPAGHMHAYLRGTAVELMANSDNVLRGGLTKKHIDVDALIQVVDFVAEDVQILTTKGSDGVYHYETPAPEFELFWLEPLNGRVELPLPDTGRIVLVIEGEITLHHGDETMTLPSGGAAFLPAGESIEAHGAGQFFMAAPGVHKE